MMRFKEALPAIEQAHPKARWILLTLIVPNTPKRAFSDFAGHEQGLATIQPEKGV